MDVAPPTGPDRPTPKGSPRPTPKGGKRGVTEKATPSKSLVESPPLLTSRADPDAGTGGDDDFGTLDSMIRRLLELHGKLRTGTAERGDAAELERLKRRYEAAAVEKTSERAAARERLEEMRGKVATAARRQVIPRSHPHRPPASA